MITGSDWGWYTTLADNLAKVGRRVPCPDLPGEPD